jgi:hypothetical protein
VRRPLGAALALGLALASGSVRATTEPARRDLAADEQRGGHTLSRHVGKTDQQLRQRLSDQPNISAASTYTDRETAELTVGRVLELQAGRVTSWVHRRGSRPNLALRAAELRGPPVGRVMLRGRKTAVAAHGAVVVLRWDERASTFYVLTSYPEQRE